MKKQKTLIFILLAALMPLSAQVRYGDLNLNAANELLFTAEVSIPTYGTYSTLLQADIAAAEMDQLTIFPETFSIIGDTGILQIQNRFGLFRSTGEDEPFVPLTHFPAFVKGREIRAGKIMSIGASRDGRFLTYLVATSPAYGELRLYDLSGDTEVTVSTGIELNLDEAPLQWSPDSKFFVYARDGVIYYYSIDHYDNARTLNENLRRIGTGQISNVYWAGDSSLYYVRGSQVYRILSVEFFTRSLYQDLLKIGTIVGKLPYNFDPNFDEYWVSPDGRNILMNKEGRNLTVHYLQTNDFVDTGETLSLPYLYLPRNTRVETVLWSEDDVITILTGSLLHGRSQTAVYRIDLQNEEARSAFTRTSDTDVSGLVLSPDGTKALVVTAEGADIRTYSSWESLVSFDQEDSLHGVWIDDDTIALAGRYEINQYPAAGGDGTLRALSQADSAGYGKIDGDVQVEARGAAYSLGESGWSSLDAVAVAESAVSSDDYRVYLERLSSGAYENMVMVRNVDTVGTVPLFPRPQTQYEPFPNQDEQVSLTNFSHGSRIRRREVSLVFNAIDSVAGLTEILNTLNDYDVRATFFINGDFIRRHPGAVTEISESGHEVGSLFFTNFDMSDARFRINADFVKQGLARNEDEYFNVTGNELSLMWHAPYYFVSPEIISASREMNYAYIGRDVDGLDWVPKRDETGLSRLYESAADIIENIIEEKRPGSIVAMTVGKPGEDRPDGGRDDYLFQRLDLVLNNLIERGYEIVPISTLMDHAQ